jgi:hypothetical protein
MNGTEMNTSELLSELDAAPATVLTAAERERSDSLLRAIVADRGPAIPPRARTSRATRGWLVATAGALALVVIGGSVVASHYGYFGGHAAPLAAAGPLTTVELAGWTSTPLAVSADSATVQTAEKWCVGSMGAAPAASSPVTFTNLDQRGQITSMFVNRGGYAMLCIAGPGGTGFWELDGDPGIATKALEPTAINIESAGSHGDGATGFTYAEGRVGSQVASISVTDSGRVFSATVQDGRWSAWWPTPDPHGTVTGTVTITATDGSVSTVSGSTLQP